MVLTTAPMGKPSQCCNRLLNIRTWLRVIVGLFGLSTIVYVYLYNISIVKTSSQLLRLRQPFNLSAWAQQSLSFFPLSSAKEYVFNFTRNNNHTDAQNFTKIPEIIPILTLFTTWPSNDKKYRVRNITLKNWAHFKPLVRPVFFGSNGTNLKEVTKHGWDVLPVSKTAASGIPVLKYMYMDVVPKFKSLFYGYSNGDILFDEGLIKTLLVIANTTLSGDKPIMIIGRRTNVPNVTEAESDVHNLAKVAKKRGKLFMTIAEDYFITDSSYPWSEIPGIVIGRRAYDNWLVLNSCKQKYSVIDATKTILALHQTTKAGNFEGMTHKDSNYNAGLLYKMYKNIRYMAGSTSCAPWYSEATGNATHTKIKLSKRLKLDKVCYPY